MADTKEFESLDELFRKTFDNLPETPADSGWDTPSERVWQHVQSQIKPPRSGWSGQTLRLIAAFAVTLAVGLYLFLNRAENPKTHPATPPPTIVETAETPTAANTTTATGERPAVLETTSPAKSSRKKPAAANQPANKAAVYHNRTETEAAKATQDDSTADTGKKPSGKTPVSPNTTERRKAELARRAEIAWKTPLQPLPQRWPKGMKKDSEN